MLDPWSNIWFLCRFDVHHQEDPADIAPTTYRLHRITQPVPTVGHLLRRHLVTPPINTQPIALQAAPPIVLHINFTTSSLQSILVD